MVEDGLKGEARKAGGVDSQCELSGFAPERGIAGVAAKCGREPFESLVNSGVKVSGGAGCV